MEYATRKRTFMESVRSHGRPRLGRHILHAYPSTVAEREKIIGKLMGIWLEDRGASDLQAYEQQLDLMSLSGFAKTTALNLLEGLEVTMSPSYAIIRISFLTVVPFFKVTESYDLTRTTMMPRRDLKLGQQQARAFILREDTLQIASTWGEPNSAKLSENFTLLTPDVLQVEAHLEVGGRGVTSRRLFNRSTEWQPKYTFTDKFPLWNPFSKLTS